MQFITSVATLHLKSNRGTYTSKVTVVRSFENICVKNLYVQKKQKLDGVKINDARNTVVYYT